MNKFVKRSVVVRVPYSLTCERTKIVVLSEFTILINHLGTKGRPLEQDGVTVNFRMRSNDPHPLTQAFIATGRIVFLN